MECPNCGSEDVQPVKGGLRHRAGCLMMSPVGLLLSLFGATPEDLLFSCSECEETFVAPAVRRRQVTSSVALVAVVVLVFIVAAAAGVLTRPKSKIEQPPPQPELGQPAAQEEPRPAETEPAER